MAGVFALAFQDSLLRLMSVQASITSAVMNSKTFVRVRDLVKIELDPVDDKDTVAEALKISPETVNIDEIMSRPVVSVDPAMDIRYCSRLSENFGPSRTPVVDSRKAVGYTDMVFRGVRERLS